MKPNELNITKQASTQRALVLGGGGAAGRETLWRWTAAQQASHKAAGGCGAGNIESHNQGYRL